MKNPIRVDTLRRATQRFVDMQPIHAHIWVVVAGDGIDIPYSYAFSYSYVGAFADTGRETFRDFFARDGGSVAMKNFVVVLPYVSDSYPIPVRGQQMILYTMSGTQYARVWVNFVQPRTVETVGNTGNGIYAVECHVERLEG